MNKFSDKDLLMRIAAGDHDAFTALFKSYSNPLYWHAYKLLKSEFWAEEIVQDIFTHIWADRQNFSNLNSPSAYLYRMVANRSLDLIRRQELEVKMQYFVGQQLHPNATGNTNESRDLQKIDVLIRSAIETLPVQRKLVYQLKYQQKLSYEEIAQKLSITKHTVRNQIASALRSIRTYLLEKGDFLLLLSWYCSVFVKH